MNRSFAIQCRGITKTFRSSGIETHALRGVDLDIYEGEFMLLVGPSGCGKTTFLSIIAGILEFDKGELSVENRHYNQMTEEEMLDYRAKHVGFIFQEFNLVPTLTVAENISLPLLIGGMNRKEALEKALEILKEVELGDRGESMPGQLSGGQKQRVAIARGLVHRPSILICDEPTSALDHATGDKIMELMHAINRKLKTTFIVVTHDSRIFKYADRIAHMNDGSIENIEAGASDGH